MTHDYIPGFYIGDRPKVVTSRFEYEDSHTLERFLATDGYEGLKKCLAMSPQEMHDEVRNSTVLGRGGAGFPAGVKWGFTPEGVWPRYLVVNGDESEPGTYKDRLLMERDPHQLIEGCLIACYAAGLSQLLGDLSANVYPCFGNGLAVRDGLLRHVDHSRFSAGGEVTEGIVVIHGVIRLSGSSGSR